jgi:rhodanese-related sulfurtransferase
MLVNEVNGNLRQSGKTTIGTLLSLTKIRIPATIREPMKHTPRFLAIVEEARKNVRETDAQSIKQRLDRGENFQLVDVREESEFARGHLPGARHVGKGIIERDIETLIPDPDADIVLYCGGGYRSALAADALQRMGYTNVTSMDGGWRVWNEAGYQTEKE